MTYSRPLAWAILVGGFALIASMSNARGDSIHINQGGGPSNPGTTTANSSVNAHPRANAHSSSAAHAGARATATTNSRSASTSFGGTAQGGNGGYSSANSSTGGSDSHDRIIIAPGLAGLTGSPCMGSTTASVGVPVFSAGVGTTWEDDQCTLRENLKVVAQFDSVLAHEMLHDLKGVQAARYRMGELVSIHHEAPAWCEGRDLETASEYDRRMCR